MQDNMQHVGDNILTLTATMIHISGYNSETRRSDTDACSPPAKSKISLPSYCMGTWALIKASPSPAAPGALTSGGGGAGAAARSCASTAFCKASCSAASRREVAAAERSVAALHAR